MADGVDAFAGDTARIAGEAAFLATVATPCAGGVAAVADLAASLVPRRAPLLATAETPAEALPVRLRAGSPADAVGTVPDARLGGMGEPDDCAASDAAAAVDVDGFLADAAAPTVPTLGLLDGLVEGVACMNERNIEF